MNYKNFEDLPIWQLAREIVRDTYKLFEKNDKIKLAVAKLNHTKTQVRIRRFS